MQQLWGSNLLQLQVWMCWIVITDQWPWVPVGESLQSQHCKMVNDVPNAQYIFSEITDLCDWGHHFLFDCRNHIFTQQLFSFEMLLFLPPLIKSPVKRFMFKCATSALSVFNIFIFILFLWLELILQDLTAIYVCEWQTGNVFLCKLKWHNALQKPRQSQKQWKKEAVWVT